MSISRRDFLLRSAGFVTVSAMVPRWSVTGARNFEESLGSAYPGRTLVVLELMGGNDGLNTVVPYADNAYSQVRSRIGIPAGSILQLDSKLGLNGMTVNAGAKPPHGRPQSPPPPNPPPPRPCHAFPHPS